MHTPTSITLPPTIGEPTPTDRLKQNCKRSKKVSGCRIKNMGYYRQVNTHIADMPEFGTDSITPQQIELRQRFEQYRKNLIGCACNSLYRKSKTGRECSYISSQTCSHRLCNVCNMLRSRKLRRKWRAFLQDEERNVPLRKAQAHFWGLTPVYEDVASNKISGFLGDAVYDLGISTDQLKIDGQHNSIFSGEEVIKRELVYWEDENGAIYEQLPPTSGAEILKKFDLMHLTLTVPHEGGKWLGEDYYAQQLLEKFNEMRKAKWWVQYIFGGEYTVETTQNADGLHIHIHALLFVDKDYIGSRNSLYEKITRRWNHLTIDRDSSRPRLLDAERRKGLEKGFAHLIANRGTEQEDRDRLNNLLLDLDGRGSTMVGLKSLYYEISAEEYSQRRSKTFTQDGKFFSYSNGGNLKSVLKGVIECLKYHFEPCSMEDEDGNLNLPLLEKVLPNIYRQRLYGKFGGFYGVKQLNVLEEPINVEDMLDEAAETGTEAFDPATGQPADPSEYVYVIADAQCISYDKDKPLAYLHTSKIKYTIGGDEVVTLGAAVRALAYYSFKKKE